MPAKLLIDSRVDAADTLLRDLPAGAAMAMLHAGTDDRMPPQAQAGCI